jgi:streptomycin 3"-adenylyltransferase
MLNISGKVARVSQSRPVEMTVVTESIVKPWRYLPELEFMFGEWLRDAFESRKPPRYPIKSADLTTVIAMAIQANMVLSGPPLESIIDGIPRQDVFQSMIDGIPELLNDFHGDERNVLLTFARIWYTLVKKEFASKDEAARWVRDHLPEEYHIAIDRAVNSYLGMPEDHDKEFIQRARFCIDYMVSQIQLIGDTV